MKLKGLYGSYLEQKAEKQRQEELREAYHVEDKDVVVVEKRHLLEAVFRVIGTILRVLVMIAIFVLVAVGTTALVYPESREAVLKILFDALETIRM